VFRSASNALSWAIRVNYLIDAAIRFDPVGNHPCCRVGVLSTVDQDTWLVTTPQNRLRVVEWARIGHGVERSTLSLPGSGQLNIAARGSA